MQGHGWISSLVFTGSGPHVSASCAGITVGKDARVIHGNLDICGGLKRLSTIETANICSHKHGMITIKTNKKKKSIKSEKQK